MEPKVVWPHLYVLGFLCSSLRFCGRKRMVMCPYGLPSLPLEMCDYDSLRTALEL